ncbi:serine hydrolase [Bacteroides sp. 224]|uniref:serine hydrolase domain-containing protein n=1 Tax=Bacteroides sp. 224 TaxID=2302936 RepID=UPI0013D147BC|nr:serine hydrolase [Bacteroides sp. 224]NDV64705.1 class C beta-lactamase-related serine hydrolase [Bacteroides sp. 224]
MKKRIFWISIPFLLLIAGIAVFHTLAPIITGYAAKNLASGIFVAGRTQESLEKEDLSFFPINLNTNIIDWEKKEVTSRFLFWKSKAIYIEGFGCTLVRDFSEKEIQSRPYTIVPTLPATSDTIPWPAGDKLSDSIPSTLNAQKLALFLDTVFADSLPMKGTFAVAIAYKNQLITERYRDDLSADNLFLSWSMAKSITNTLTGILVSQNKMNLEIPVAIKYWQTDERAEITLANLLQMNSGLAWNEDYGSNSDVNRMLFKTGNMSLFAVDKSMKAKPDSTWYYSSGTTNIVCQLIRDAIGNDTDYYAFPRKALFNKIGMRNAIFEVDASGTFIGSSYIYASMRDYVRYGLLYLNKGNWLGEQIFPEEWIDFTTTTSKGSNGRYGAFFWLNKGSDYPDAPADTYLCKGHDGQFIFIIPSKELVIVRTGFSQKGVFDVNTFLKGILESLE